MHQNTKKELIDLLISLWTEHELETFKFKDLNGEDYSFAKQIEERYFQYEATFINQKDVKECQQKVVEMLRPHLSELTYVFVRNYFLDQLENTVFVTKEFLERHKTTIVNLQNNLMTHNEDMHWLIDLIVEGIDKNVVNLLEITIDDKTFNLREQLKARWLHYWLWISKQEIHDYLSEDASHEFIVLSQVKNVLEFQEFLNYLEINILKYIPQWNLEAKSAGTLVTLKKSRIFNVFYRHWFLFALLLMWCSVMFYLFIVVYP